MIDLAIIEPILRILGAQPTVWAGRRLGEDTAAVLGEIGVTPERLAALRAEGVV